MHSSVSTDTADFSRHTPHHGLNKARFTSICRRSRLTACLAAAILASSVGSVWAKISYPQIVSRLKLAASNQDARLSVIGTSAKGTDIYAITVGDGTDSSGRQIRILVLAGQHGNESVSVQAAVRSIDSLTRRATWELPPGVVMTFVPVVNPDGYSANRRCNSRGVDLNRDWKSLSQPETAAVMALARKLRPHVVIDQHEWTVEDPNSPNCVEVSASVDEVANRIARAIALSAKANTSGGPLTLQPVLYRRLADGRLAHRRFAADGVCALLVETKDGYHGRTEAYQTVLKTTVNALVSPASETERRDIAALLAKRPSASELPARTSAKPVARHNSTAQTSCWIALGACAAYILGITVHSRTSSRKKYPYDRRSLVRATPVSEVVMADIPLRSKIQLVRICRTRPTDRGEEPSFGTCRRGSASG